MSPVRECVLAADEGVGRMSGSTVEGSVIPYMPSFENHAIPTDPAIERIGSRTSTRPTGGFAQCEKEEHLEIHEFLAFVRSIKNETVEESERGAGNRRLNHAQATHLYLSPYFPGMSRRQTPKRHSMYHTRAASTRY